jgi:hypothetical protein
MPCNTSYTRFIFWKVFHIYYKLICMFYTLQRLYMLLMSHDYPQIAEYSLYRRALLHTSKVCARKSLQDCSMVSSSLLHTHRGFTAGVSITPTQKPPLVPCGFQPSQLYPHHPTVPPSQLHRTSQRFALLASPHSRLVRQD